MGTGRGFGAVLRAATAALAIGSILGACGTARRSTISAPQPVTPTAPSTTSTSTTTPPPPPTCPLTGQPAPGGKVPQRPALAIKVENLPAARPQYGLSTADVVYEEPVEGGITRFIAIYQCRDAARVEPVRSGRLIDPQIVEQYGAHPLFAYSGAIQPAVDAIDSSSLIDVGAYRGPTTNFWRDRDRVIPHNLITSTSVLYGYGASVHAPQVAPSSPFTYGAQPAGATPAASVHLPYEYSDITWTWQPGISAWTRSYSDTGAATLGEGGQISAANVIVMKVVMYPSPYVEDATGTHENLLTLTGTGPVQVFRNGGVTTGTWSRPNLGANTSYLDSSGQPIPLTAGQTWIELVPTTVPTSYAP